MAGLNGNMKKVFVGKDYVVTNYKWSPIPNSKVISNTKGKAGRPFFCSATAGSNGQDWITTYCYSVIVLDNGTLSKNAYVECDYVQ